MNKLKTLIVEDTPIALLGALTVLNNFNLEIDSATNGKEALELVSNNSYQIIFLDLGLPDIDGIEVAKLIRTSNNNATSPEVTIIALTAHSRAEYKEQCELARLNGFLTKPLKDEDIIRILPKFDNIAV